MNTEYCDRIKENKILNQIIQEEARDIETTKEEIKKINKKISDVEVKL